MNLWQTTVLGHDKIICVSSRARIYVKHIASGLFLIKSAREDFHFHFHFHCIKIIKIIINCCCQCNFTTKHIQLWDLERWLSVVSSFTNLVMLNIVSNFKIFISNLLTPVLFRRCFCITLNYLVSIQKFYFWCYVTWRNLF